MADDRMGPTELLGAAVGLVGSRTDEQLAAWAKEFGGKLVNEVRLLAGDLGEARDCLTCSQNANSAGVSFFREVAESLTSLPAGSEGRRRIFDSAMATGPQLMGQIAAAQATLLSRDPEERIRIARATVDGLMGKARESLRLTIDEDNLTVH